LRRSLPLARLWEGWTGFVMCHTPLPEGAVRPLVQSLPLGSSPGAINPGVTNTGGLRDQ
jgi:hypothetical protein